MARRQNEPPSRELLENQLSLAFKTNDVGRKVSVLSQLAGSASRQGLTKQCDDYLQQALKVAMDSGESTLLARVFSSIAKAARKRGDLEQARDAIGKALNANTKTTTSVTKAYIKLDAAYIYSDLRDQENAMFYAQTALDSFSRLGMSKEADECLILLDSFDNST